MKIGDIYNFTENRIRILMFDDKEIFYQTLNEDDTFVYAKYKTINYYRTEREYFNENAKFIKSLEFNKQELEIHRPDLPLRLNCFSDIFWTFNKIEKNVEFTELLKSFGIEKEKLQGLNSSKVVIFPTSQQQSSKKPSLVQNKIGYLSGEDLLFECFKIQSEHVNKDKPYFSRFRLIIDGREEKRLSGIGIYRLGIKGNVPSFYLGGEMSMMELESENSLIVKK